MSVVLGCYQAHMKAEPGIRGKTFVGEVSPLNEITNWELSSGDVDVTPLWCSLFMALIAV